MAESVECTLILDQDKQNRKTWTFKKADHAGDGGKTFGDFCKFAGDSFLVKDVKVCHVQDENKLEETTDVADGAKLLEICGTDATKQCFIIKVS